MSTDLRELQAQIREWPAGNQPQGVLIEEFLDCVLRELTKVRVAYRRNKMSSSEDDAIEDRIFVEEGLANAVIFILQLAAVMGSPQCDLPGTIVSRMQILNEFYAPQNAPKNPPLLSSVEKW
jgi:hypothetical protein